MKQLTYEDCLIMASKVDFLEGYDEIKLYAANLYNAYMWGKKIDKENEEKQRIDGTENR